ncbi:MAG: hypothetical protein ACREJ2_15335 [Planctomycetota bacterium]
MRVAKVIRHLAALGFHPVRMNGGHRVYHIGQRTVSLSVGGSQNEISTGQLGKVNSALRKIDKPTV